jgi:hypothetical protein
LDRASGTAPLSVGGNTSNFVINEQDSPNMRIFLDSKCVKKARKIAGKPLEEVLEKLGVDQLRQLRSKFDHLDTFNLWRCSGPLTATTLHRPYRVYTISSFGHGKGGAFAAGEIFSKIGKAVILKGKTGVLCRDDVQHAIQICGSSQDYLRPLQAILHLFNEDKEILIVGNSNLNTELEKMAKSLSSRISQGNKSIAIKIEKVFGLATSSA